MRYFIYALVKGTDVYYVGYSTRLEQRRKRHALAHPTWKLMTLGAYPTREIGLDSERRWIQRLHIAGHPLINICEGGNAGITERDVSYLTRARLSETQRGRVRSPETRAKMSKAQKGTKFRSLSIQHKRRISEALTGHSVSSETRDKIGAANRNKVRSPELRARISKTLRNRTVSPTAALELYEQVK